MATSPPANPPSMAVAGEQGGDLSRWVSRIQKQHTGSPGAGALAAGGSTGGSMGSAGRGDLAGDGDGGSGSGSRAGVAGGADELEEEMRLARETRLKRRSQLSRHNSSAAAAAPGVGAAKPSCSPLPASLPALDHTPGSSARSPPPPSPSATESSEQTLRRLLGTRSSADASSSAAVPASSADTDMAPSRRTNALLERYGGAMGPTGTARPGTNATPASLASFMGGKASGPRLGKLAGDGRNAPPEASLVDTSRRALPGLTRGPSSPPTGAEGSSGKSLASFLEARASASGQSRSPTLGAQGSEHKNPLGAPAAVRSPSLPKASATSSVAVNAASNTAAPVMADAATSPLKPGTAQTAKVINPTVSAVDSGMAVSSPPSAAGTDSATMNMMRSSSNDLQAAKPPSGVSKAFMATQQANERAPTASLTRLRSKRMVEQRVREAQERSAVTSPDSTSSPQLRSSVTGDTDFNPAISGAESAYQDEPVRPPSPFKRREADRQMRSPPAQMSNALPGMFSGAPANQGPRNLYAVNRKTQEEEAAQYASPLRLPGMGGNASPFRREEGSKDGQAQEYDENSKPLQPLAKGRIKPQRAARAASGQALQEKSGMAATTSSSTLAPEATLGDERISHEAFASARGVFGTQQAPASDSAESASPLTVDTQRAKHDVALSRSPKSSSLPDSAAKIAESTAALEALLDGRDVKTPEEVIASPLQARSISGRTGKLRIAKNKNHVTIDTSAIQSAVKPAGLHGQTVSLEVFNILPNGQTQVLSGDDHAVLYETEAHVVTHKFKDLPTSGDVQTHLYAHVGRLSSVVTGESTAQSKAVMDVAQRYRVVPSDARQGRESFELIKLLGGRLVTREGSRKYFDPQSTCLYQVRGGGGACLIDQVDMLTSSLYSASSFIVGMLGDFFVWHGMGSATDVRKAATAYVHDLRGDPSKPVAEYEEGHEDELFWTCFERGVEYANAWHHQRTPLLSEEDRVPHLWTTVSPGVGSGPTKLREQAPFSALDIRRNGVSVLQLPLEIYVLIGPDARSQRSEIGAAIEAANTRARLLHRQRGPQGMPLPVHVVVFPTLVPRELRAALRYWHDEHLNGKRWQRVQLRMNVWERREALEQLQRDEYQLAELDDDLFLPVGVGLDDVKGIDI